MWVNDKTCEVKTQVPYDYYALPYCKPKHLQVVAENVGEVLEGDRIEESVYHLDMRNPQSCTLACSKKLSNKDRKKFITWLDKNHKLTQIIIHLGARTDTTEFDKEIFDELNLNYSKEVWNKSVQYSHRPFSLLYPFLVSRPYLPSQLC